MCEEEATVGSIDWVGVCSGIDCVTSVSACGSDCAVDAGSCDRVALGAGEGSDEVEGCSDCDGDAVTGDCVTEAVGVFDPVCEAVLVSVAGEVVDGVGRIME